MATTPVIPVTPPPEPTMAQIRAALAFDEPVESKPQPKTEAPEVKTEPVAEKPAEKVVEKPAEKPAEKPVEAKDTEAAPGTAKKQPEVEEIEEPELPAGVKKRIAQEAAKEARAAAAIQHAISARKAKEEELRKLTDKPGSEPVKPTESAKTEEPIEPDLDTFQGTWEEYQKAQKKYRAEYREWLRAETKKAVEQEVTARQAQERIIRERDEALKLHGAEFPELMDVLAENAPEAFQTAVSNLENWSLVAVHLAKNLDELKLLVQKYEANPYAAVAELGRLESKLTAKPPAKEEVKEEPPKPKLETKPPEEKPLPTPPAKVGGTATASVPALNLDTAPMPEFKKMMGELLDR